jgi:hypothetical protein
MPVQNAEFISHSCSTSAYPTNLTTSGVRMLCCCAHGGRVQFEERNDSAFSGPMEVFFLYRRALPGSLTPTIDPPVYLSASPPMMACVVDTGMPVKDARNRKTAAAISAANWLTMYHDILELQQPHAQQLERNCLSRRIRPRMPLDGWTVAFGQQWMPLYGWTSGFHWLNAEPNEPYL